MTMRIGLADLDPTRYSSFSFYDFLPGQGLEVDGAPPAADALYTAARLLAVDLLQVPDEDLDKFAALLLTHGADLAPDGTFERLADTTARAFATLLGNDAERPRRMRLTRLSLMLRVILDRDQDTSFVVEEATLPCKNPWDFIASTPSSFDGWAASCDDDNLRRLGMTNVDWSKRLGLPTQLDTLGDGLWVGSHYSNGGCIVLGTDDAQPEVIAVPHASPLVLSFDHGIHRIAVDADGALWLLDGVKVASKLLQLPGKVHRARIIGGVLHAFDWGQAGLAMQVDLDHMEIRTLVSGDVIVCNDICAHGDALYAICKLQGRVFKTNVDWIPMGTRLSAGVGQGQLLDPIMIRSDGNTLSVLNWFSAKLVKLQAF